ncbi:2-C-methyl-D-erythritol 4-phosphate cytidylyltransferase [bacterium]|nr:2-C-methyl-D-erythritol 4-phosphate cytidylyltransferase [bacterium]
MEKFSVVIPAAGTGKRMNSQTPKQFLEICGKPVLAYTLETFAQVSEISELVIATGKNCFTDVEKILSKINFPFKTELVEGGKERQDSVFCGLQALKSKNIVLVHDGVRPFVTKNEILKIYQKVSEFGGAVLAVPTKDTIKIVENGFVKTTPERKTLWSIQTPQGFTFSVLFEAEKQAQKQGFYSTDEAAIVEKFFPNQKITVVEGTYSNLKITSQEDLIFAENYLKAKNL